VELPDIDGFAVAERLRQAGSQTAIVLASSRESADFSSLVAESGARGFVTKAELTGCDPCTRRMRPGGYPRTSVTDLVVATPVFLDLTFVGLESLPALGEERFAAELLRSPGVARSRPSARLGSGSTQRSRRRSVTTSAGTSSGGCSARKASGASPRARRRGPRPRW
jgi:hypothetical protein